MLDELRLLLAVIFFGLGVYLVWDLFANGFEAVILIAAVLSFVVAHYVKPKRVDEDDPSALWDFLDFFIDIPFKTIALVLRAISKPLRGDIDGIDL